MLSDITWALLKQRYRKWSWWNLSPSWKYSPCPTHSARPGGPLATDLLDNSVIEKHYWGSFLPVAIRQYSTYLSPSCAHPQVILSCQPGLQYHCTCLFYIALWCVAQEGRLSCVFCIWCFRYFALNFPSGINNAHPLLANFSHFHKKRRLFGKGRSVQGGEIRPS